jgi:transaldolase
MNVSVRVNPLRELAKSGQSAWLDDLRRIWLNDGTLARLIAEDGLSGVTSNPAIFAKAIGGGAEYEHAIRELAGTGAQTGAIYEALVLEDVQRAADLLRPTYEATAGGDGFVSLEVSPHLADDTDATLTEAQRLWRAFDRPNAMIKVPGTRAGLPAIRALVAAGVNVNVTLLFSPTRYREVVDAFMSGLEQRATANEPLDRVASVASFFLSRIDTLVDAKLDALGSAPAQALRGRAAIAAARLAYALYQEWTTGERWQRLASKGARAQRLLWASTSTKDPAYPDTQYVEALIGPQTVNTMPHATFEAYRDHGRPAIRLTNDLNGAQAVRSELQRLGIDLKDIGEQLEREGIRKFIEPYDKLVASVAERAAALAPRSLAISGRTPSRPAAPRKSPDGHT